jgi:hypothetical protein
MLGYICTSPTAIKMTETVSYVALVLSVSAVFLVLLSGFTRDEDDDERNRLMSVSHVWHYNHETKVASTHSDLHTVCVGYEDCETSGDGRVLRINGGIQLGSGPIFKTINEGRHLYIEDGQGKQILRADLSSGAAIVGEGTILPSSGIQLVGYPTNSSDTSKWVATSGFDLFPGDPSAPPLAQVHSVVHTEDASIRGVRIAPPGGVQARHALHVTSAGIVVGDAPLSFLQNYGQFPPHYPTIILRVYVYFFYIRRK